MQWHIERKGEQFYGRAKEAGYRSRAAFKLLEIQEKFHIIKKNDVVIDLGAAPGSWSQVASELVGPSGKVIGVDVQPVLGLGRNFTFIRADIIHGKGKITSEVKDADVVLADLSPEFSGSKEVDIGRAHNLASASLELAKKILKEKGNFVCKIFQGSGFEDFIKETRKYFGKVVAFKPKASQKESAEVYVVCLRK